MKSMEIMKGVESDLASQVIGCAIEVHRHLGPGLLESAYESFETFGNQAGAPDQL